MRTALEQARGLAIRMKEKAEASGKGGKGGTDYNKIAKMFEDYTEQLTEMTYDPLWPKDQYLQKRRWPGDVYNKGYNGTLWDPVRFAAAPAIKEKIQTKARKDSKFFKAYAMEAPFKYGKERKWLRPASEDRDPTAEEIAAEEAKKLAAEEAAKGNAISDAKRASDVEMKFGVLQMSFKGPMMQPGKSREERENDLIIMLRNMFAAMDSDLVGKDKELGIVKVLYPKVQEKVDKESGTVTRTDEVQQLFDKWGSDWDIMVPASRTPPVFERVMMTMHTIPSFYNRAEACKIMLAYADEKAFEKNMNKWLDAANHYTEAFDLCGNLEDLHKMLHGVLVAANFIQHRKQMPGMKDNDRSLKENLCMDDLEHFCSSLTGYCDSKEWSDNENKKSLPIFVAHWLEDEKFDMEKLAEARKMIKAATKFSLFKVVSELDYLENEYKNLMRLGGLLPALDPDNPLEVTPVPRNAGFKDGFKSTIDKTLKKWKPILGKIDEARNTMFEAALKIDLIFLRNEVTAKQLKRYFGFEAEKLDKMHPSEDVLKKCLRCLDIMVDACYEANKAAMFKM